MSEANYKFQPRLELRRVYGLDSSYTKGYGVVYDHTSTDAALVTVQDAARGKYVRNPTAAAYNKYFAGVLTGGRSDKGMVEIAEPGSDPCEVYVGEAATCGQIVSLDCGDNAGKFMLNGEGRGKGSGIILQTITEAGLAHVKLFDGSEDEGLLQIIATGASGAVVLTAEGLSRISTAAATGGLTNTLANGTVKGQRKSYYISAVHATPQDLVVTVTTGVQMDGTTALASITLNAAAESATLEWDGVQWQLISYKGATLA